MPPTKTVWEDLAVAWQRLLLFLGLAVEGYVPHHAYAVVGVGEDKALGRFVVLYNPYGCYEGRRDEKDDGCFRIPLRELVERFDTMTMTT